MRTGHSPRNVLDFPPLPRPFPFLPIVSNFPRISENASVQLVINAEYVIFDRAPHFITTYIKKKEKKVRWKDHSPAVETISRKHFCRPRAGRQLNGNPVLSQQARQHRSIRLWDPTDAERGKDLGSSLLRNLGIATPTFGNYRMKDALAPAVLYIYIGNGILV